MRIFDQEEEEQEFIVSEQQDDMDSATIPTTKIQFSNVGHCYSSLAFS